RGPGGGAGPGAVQRLPPRSSTARPVSRGAPFVCAGACTIEFDGGPAGADDVFQVIDGGVVYTQPGLPSTDGEPAWTVVDTGSWVAASPLAVFGWLYGVAEAEQDGGRYEFRATGAGVVEHCPAELRDDFRHALTQLGQHETAVTGRARLDDAGRVVELSVDIPAGCVGADGTVHDAARTELAFDDLGLPAAITPPDAGPSVSLAEYVERVRRASGDAF
ncbi:MAG: hypothetical protein ACT4RN_17945, partial [Pseudonocardia sp.]